MRIKVAVLIAVILVLLPSDAISEPVRFKNGAVCTTAAGNRVDLTPKSVAFTDTEYSALDVEMKRLQDAETRLKAENTSLRKSDVTGRGTLYAIGGALVTGLGVGYWLANR